jgi:hypothetical protein
VNWHGEFTTITSQRVARFTGVHQAAASVFPGANLSANFILCDPLRAGRAQSAPRVRFRRKTAADTKSSAALSLAADTLPTFSGWGFRQQSPLRGLRPQSSSLENPSVKVG